MKCFLNLKKAIAWVSLSWAFLMPGMAFSLENPVSMLNTVTHNVMRELRQHQAEVKHNNTKLYALVDRFILPHVDFAEMARWVVGRNAWKTADASTQTAFVAEFKTMVVRTYARSLLEYRNQDIEFLPVRGDIDSKKRIEVLSLIKESGKAPIRMDYHLIRVGDSWKVYDIIVEGVSLMQGYRAQFAEDIREGGLDKAIERMKRHNQSR